MSLCLSVCLLPRRLFMLPYVKWHKVILQRRQLVSGDITRLTERAADTGMVGSEINGRLSEEDTRTRGNMPQP